MLTKVLISKLPKHYHATLSTQLTNAIGLRTEWGQRYKFVPRHDQNGHEQYIGFLKLIQRRLGRGVPGPAAVQHGKAIGVAATADDELPHPLPPRDNPPAVVREDEHEDEGTATGPPADVELAKQPSKNDDSVAQDGDDGSDLTPTQADFMDFFNFLIAKGNEALSIWAEVSLGIMPVGRPMGKGTSTRAKYY